MPRKFDYQPIRELNYQAAYDCLEPEDQAKVNTWVKRFTDANNGGPEAQNGIIIRGIGEALAFELVMKTVVFVVTHDRTINRRGAELSKLIRS